MPLYEYECRDCQARVELLIQGGQQPKCPTCGGDHLTKQLSVVAAPTRDPAAGQLPRAGGSCGPGCGCHPHP